MDILVSEKKVQTKKKKDEKHGIILTLFFTLITDIDRDP